MRNSKCIIIYCVSAVLLFCMNFGCAPKREIYATYTLPPAKVVDFITLKDMQISEPVVKITGNAGPAIKTIYQNYIKERLTGQIYKERFYSISDDIYRNMDGENCLCKIIAGQSGYNLVHSDKPDAAKILISAVIKINKEHGVDIVETELVRQGYTVERNDKGVPYSKADKEQRSVKKRMDKFKYIKISANADLTVKVIDKNGIDVKYKESFNNLEFEQKIGGEGNVSALPSHFEIAANLFCEPIQKIVKNISPHKEKRLLKINEKGDKSSIVLMKANAFIDAVNSLESVLQKNKNKYETVKKKIESEYQEKVDKIQKSSMEPEKKKAETDKLRKEIDEQLAKEQLFMSSDYENYAIIMEIMGYIDDAIEFFEKAYQADPNNQTAKLSYAKVIALQDREKIMKQKSIIDNLKLNHEYKSEEYKNH
ncbi:putative Tetratricopeptide repeat protein [Candidatus Magnetomoraceae bacterium gMMP-1]